MKFKKKYFILIFELKLQFNIIIPNMHFCNSLRDAACKTTKLWHCPSSEFGTRCLPPCPSQHIIKSVHAAVVSVFFYNNILRVAHPHARTPLRALSSAAAAAGVRGSFSLSLTQPLSFSFIIFISRQSLSRQGAAD